MDIDAIVSYNLDDLSTLRVIDTSNYGSPNPDIADVNATRFVFSSVNGQANRQTNVTALQANYEYQLVGTGFMTIDGKFFSAGEKFILRVSVTVAPPSTLQIDETGYYSPVTDYIPSVDAYEQFVPSQVGIPDNLYFPDNIFTCTYDVYTTEYVGNENLPVGTYIVTGSPGGVIYYEASGNNYNVGEVFYADSVTEASYFENITGVNTVVKLYGSTTFYFMTYKYAYQVYESYINAIAEGQCGTSLQSNFVQVHALLHSNIINFEKNITVDLTAMQNTLDIINTNYSNLYV
jgi:hypothetical protein